MAGELERALSSVNTSLGNKDRKYRELSLLQGMEQKLEQEKQQEIQSEVAYSQYEDQVNLFSQSLLEEDRKKIRGLHEKGQMFLREELKKHGGSYSEFMKNGGIRVLQNYKNSIINSEEALMYKKNAENLAHIIKARDAGKGGFINGVDLKNLEMYQANGGGEITYNGLLSPIEMPPASSYGLGHQIPPEQILKNKNNYSAILSNYMRENPDKPQPNQAQLIEYTRRKYSGMGNNQALLYSQRSNQAKSKKSRDSLKYTVMSSARKGIANINRNADGTAGFTINDDYEANYALARSSNKRIFSDKKFVDVSETDRDGILTFDVDETRPIDAYEFSALNKSFSRAAKRNYESNFDDETKTYRFRSEDLHGANGVKMENEEVYNLKPKTVILALSGKGKNNLSDRENEEDFFAVEFSDKKGKIRKKPSDRYRETIKDTKLQYRPWEVWEDPKTGRLYYKPLDVEGISNSQAWTEAIGGENDYTEEVEAQNTIVRREEAAAWKTELKNKENKDNFRRVFNSSSFKNIVFEDLIAKSKFSSNEPDIFESLAIAFTKAKNEDINNPRKIKESIDVLSKYVIPLETRDVMRDKNLNMKDAYVSMIQELKKGSEDNPEDLKQIDRLAEYWKGTYELLTNRKLEL